MEIYSHPFLSFHPPNYLSIYPFFYHPSTFPSLHPSISYLFIHLSIHPFFRHPSTYPLILLYICRSYLSIHFVYPFIYLSILLSIHTYIYPFILSAVHLSIYIFIHQPIFLSIYPLASYLLSGFCGIMDCAPYRKSFSSCYRSNSRNPHLNILSYSSYSLIRC